MIRSLRTLVCTVVTIAGTAASAATLPQTGGRFTPITIEDPASRLGVAAETPEQIAGFEARRAGWDGFRSAHGATWKVYVDRRSGVPTLVEGGAIPLVASLAEATPGNLQARARALVAANEPVFGIRDAELVWNPDGSGPTDPDHWVLVFDRVVGGIPVEDERFILYVNQGRLVAFGASRWGAIASVPQPAVDADAAFVALSAYMGLKPEDAVTVVEPGRKVLVAAPSAAGQASRYTGPAGDGLEHRLAWRFAVRVAGEPGTWVGKVDAVDGRVLAMYDDDKYGQVTGGVYPVSNDQDCAELGCEIAGFPMSYATVTLAKKATATGDMATFACGKGPKNASANLSGPYARVQDSCGTASATGNCSSAVDFGASGGTDCTSPPGQGTGDTHAGRTSYYQINRVKEKARHWLPSNAWVNQQLLSKVNTSATCNAFWNGSVNFYRSGGGCRNTGEIGGVIHHEYGHGLDQNDGGGYDNPSEAYGDVVAILQEQRSCVGRGFFVSGTCSGYGDSCLACSGIRDMDWDRRTRHTPATPANFTGALCGGGGGPCGREVHCESYVPSEAIYDLATRDLTASGLDAASSWQLAEKLFYKSRQGSGGNAFNCSLPSSDGCAATSWFTKLRVADDDDGNLGNGTPHAAAIHAAFSRHAIACGTAADPSNLDSGTCPALASPAVTVTPGTASVSLSWAAVPGAGSYLVLRNDIACTYSSNVVATVGAPATSYVDTDLPSGFPVYYRVQAQGANLACTSGVSACATASAQ